MTDFKKLTDDAVEVGLEARIVLQEEGLEHEDRLILFNGIAQGNEVMVNIWLHALDVARERVTQRHAIEAETGAKERKRVEGE
jgi:hypothetical protein